MLICIGKKHVFIFHIPLIKKFIENHVQGVSSGGSVGFQCHMSVESEHQVNFSTAAAAHERLMRVRYAEAIGGGLIAD